MSIAWALLIIRIMVGLTLVAHGAQKAFGWFGGPGYATLTQGFRAQGFRPVQLWTALVLLGEIGGGLSLAFGFLTPLGAAGALGAMIMAVRMHWKNGFFGNKGGFEYPLTLLLVSTALGISGPGMYSFDSLFGISLPQPLLFVALALAAIIVDAIGIAILRATTRAASTGTAPAA
jgi:putative oxidoreductase